MTVMDYLFTKNVSGKAKLTCDQEGCLERTRWANRHECWREGHKCPKHYWDKTRYIKKKFRLKKQKCPCGCGRD